MVSTTHGSHDNDNNESCLHGEGDTEESGILGGGR